MQVVITDWVQLGILTAFGLVVLIAGCLVTFTEDARAHARYIKDAPHDTRETKAHRKTSRRGWPG